MSKSEPEGCIFLTDEPDQIKKKIMRASTDSTYGLTYDKMNRKHLANLIDLMALFINVDVETVSLEYKNCGHQLFKESLSKIVADYFSEFRDNYKSLNDERVIKILKDGTASASELASNNLDRFLSSIYK